MDETKDITEAEKRSEYFCLFLDACELLSLLDNKSAGKVIHAIADYFIDGETPEGVPTFTKKERRAYDHIKRRLSVKQYIPL